MVDKILGTFFSRIFVSIVMFCIVVINTNTFGAEGTGTIALVVLAMTILQLFSNFVGGGAIVYFVPRYSFSQIVLLTYVWSLLSNTLGFLLLYFLHLIPQGFETILVALSFTNSIYYINNSLIQGKEKIKLYNKIQILQAVVLIVLFSVFIFIGNFFNFNLDVLYYLLALLISYVIPVIISLSFVIKNMDILKKEGLQTLIKEAFQFGFWIQIANLAQQLNYRISYYFIEYYTGRKPLGIFELGTKLSEVVWIFPKSVALVQYARLSNCEDTQYAARITTSILKIVFCFTLLAVLILLLIPSHAIGWVFGADFIESKNIIYSLAPGIVFLSCLTIFSHHFSGFGKYWINAISSVIGLIVTLVLSLILLPPTVAQGYMKTLQMAGIITSVSYFSSLIFSFILFLKQPDTSFKMLFIYKTDFLFFKNEIKKHLNK
ncbi:MAG: oligosaccharide flippase family protein [Bacteroidales bacterium]|jgi:O-antigen/teichoic acid export membrane protein|nr:oligosaccharide flippase family protein [Bacteroidales bacterium]